MITYDRPGYGRSDRHSGRRVSDAAEDVRAIADHIGLDRFGVVGRSGGGPHALACAALLPTRVARAAALVSLAPRDADGLSWYQGMTESNISAYSAGEQSLDLLVPLLMARVHDIRTDPRKLIAALRHELTAADLSVIADPGVRSSLTRNYAEALRSGGEGWIDDLVAFLQPWGFDLSAISCPVELWHGEDDVFSPVEHTVWLASRIPTSRLRIQSKAAHFHAWRELLDILCRVALDPAQETAG
ncbi:alpha/beta fold hydrolase [Streptacidiphilus monticola]